MKNFSMMRIAIVYDWIDTWGGVERVLLTLHRIFPKADFFTSYIDHKTASWARDLNISASFIQRLPSVVRSNRVFSLMFYPYAFESFDFSQYDVVISVTSSFAKGVITKPTTKHICYLLTPARFLWVYPQLYKIPMLLRYPAVSMAAKLREWDFIAARRPDKYLSISLAVADRCKKYYQRESEVLYPPFDSAYWNDVASKVAAQNFVQKKYFLIVSRLEPYKRVDLAVETFNHLPDQNLIIVGAGSLLPVLRQKASNNTTFYSGLSDEDLAHLYKNAQALIMPQEEDFGYVALEAQFFGCPVIAFDKGGSRETVIDHQTGIFFDEQTVKSLTQAIERFHQISYNGSQSLKRHIPHHLSTFSMETFKKGMLRAVID
ncbi:glycosyltransferase [Candidatus Roizmanbacteria bacterium]|nr:glycosyltransferase [Candidatus Roizmanbacteria bacterium]